MSRTSSYEREKCFNSKCSMFANYEDELCWLDPNDDPRGFCSEKCKNEFLKNNRTYKKLQQFKQTVYSSNNRKKEKERKEQEKLADAIYLLAEPKVSKRKIIEMIIFLGLKSENLPKP